MAESRSTGGRAAQLPVFGLSSGRGDLTSFSERLSALRAGPMVRPRGSATAAGPRFPGRYADDFVAGFAQEQDARRVMDVLPKRFGRYGLTVHPTKTRLVGFTRPHITGSRIVDQTRLTSLGSPITGGDPIEVAGSSRGRRRQADFAADRIDPYMVPGLPSPTLGRTACPAVTETSRARCLLRRDQQSAVAASVPRTGPPLVAQVALTPQSTRPRYLGDVRAVGEAVPLPHPRTSTRCTHSQPSPSQRNRMR